MLTYKFVETIISITGMIKCYVNHGFTIHSYLKMCGFVVQRDGMYLNHLATVNFSGTQVYSWHKVFISSLETYETMKERIFKLKCPLS